MAVAARAVSLSVRVAAPTGRTTSASMIVGRRFGATGVVAPPRSLSAAQSLTRQPYDTDEATVQVQQPTPPRRATARVHRARVLGYIGHDPQRVAENANRVAAATRLIADITASLAANAIARRLLMNELTVARMSKVDAVAAGAVDAAFTQSNEANARANGALIAREESTERRHDLVDADAVTDDDVDDADEDMEEEVKVEAETDDPDVTSPSRLTFTADMPGYATIRGSTPRSTQNGPTIGPFVRSPEMPAKAKTILKGGAAKRKANDESEPIVVPSSSSSIPSSPPTPTSGAVDCLPSRISKRRKTGLDAREHAFVRFIEYDEREFKKTNRHWLTIEWADGVVEAHEAKELFDRGFDDERVQEFMAVWREQMKEKRNSEKEARAMNKGKKGKRKQRR